MSDDVLDAGVPDPPAAGTPGAEMTVGWPPAHAVIKRKGTVIDLSDRTPDEELGTTELGLPSFLPDSPCTWAGVLHVYMSEFELDIPVAGVPDSHDPYAERRAAMAELLFVLLGTSEPTDLGNGRQGRDAWQPFTIELVDASIPTYDLIPRPGMFETEPVEPPPPEEPVDDDTTPDGAGPEAPGFGEEIQWGFDLEERDPVGLPGQPVDLANRKIYLRMVDTDGRLRTNSELAADLYTVVNRYILGGETWISPGERLKMAGWGLLEIGFGILDVKLGLVGMAIPGGQLAGGALIVIGVDQVIQGTTRFFGIQGGWSPISAAFKSIGTQAAGADGALVAQVLFVMVNLAISIGGAFRITRLAKSMAQTEVKLLKGLAADAPEGVVRSMDLSASRLEIDFPLGQGNVLTQVLENGYSYMKFSKAVSIGNKTLQANRFYRDLDPVKSIFIVLSQRKAITASLNAVSDLRREVAEFRHFLANSAHAGASDDYAKALRELDEVLDEAASLVPKADHSASGMAADLQAVKVQAATARATLDELRNLARSTKMPHPPAPMRDDLAEHMIFRDFSGKGANKTIKGAHNVHEFGKHHPHLLSQTPHPTLPGIQQVYYRVYKAADPDALRTGKFFKTLYDPAVVSDIQFLTWGRQAAAEALSRGALTKTWIGYTPDGIRIRGFLDEATGKVTSFFPDM